MTTHRIPQVSRRELFDYAERMRREERHRPLDPRRPDHRIADDFVYGLRDTPGEDLSAIVRVAQARQNRQWALQGLRFASNLACAVTGVGCFLSFLALGMGGGVEPTAALLAFGGTFLASKGTEMVADKLKMRIEKQDRFYRSLEPVADFIVSDRQAVRRAEEAARRAEEAEHRRRLEEMQTLAAPAKTGPIELEMETDGIQMGDHFVPAFFP